MFSREYITSSKHFKWEWNAPTDPPSTGPIPQDKETVAPQTSASAAFSFRLSFRVFFFSLVTGGLMEMCLLSASSFSSFLEHCSSSNSPPDISLIHVAWQQNKHSFTQGMYTQVTSQQHQKKQYFQASLLLVNVLCPLLYIYAQQLLRTVFADLKTKWTYN